MKEYIAKYYSIPGPSARNDIVLLSIFSFEDPTA